VLFCLGITAEHNGTRTPDHSYVLLRWTGEGASTDGWNANGESHQLSHVQGEEVSDCAVVLRLCKCNAAGRIVLNGKVNPTIRKVSPPAQKFVCIYRPLYLSRVSKYLNLEYNSEVKEIVELYFYSLSAPSWPILG
jgi:hypothetical protein